MFHLSSQFWRTLSAWMIDILNQDVNFLYSKNSKKKTIYASLYFFVCFFYFTLVWVDFRISQLGAPWRVRVCVCVVLLAGVCLLRCSDVLLARLGQQRVRLLASGPTQRVQHDRLRRWASGILSYLSWNLFVRTEYRGSGLSPNTKPLRSNDSLEQSSCWLTSVTLLTG